MKDLIKSWINKANVVVIDLLPCWREEDVFSDQEAAVRFLSELTDDMLREVISKIYSPRDYLNIMAVCKKWRDIAHDLKSNPRYNLPFCLTLPKKIPLPVLLQPYGESDTHYFYSILRRKVNKICTPDITNKWICGSWRGWLATIDTKDNNTIHLINPITKIKIPLPSLSTFSELPRSSEIISSYDIEKINIISPVEGEVHVPPNSCKVIGLTAIKRLLYICTIGDDKWRKVDAAILNITDVIQFKGILCMVNNLGTLFAVEITPTTKVNPIAVVSFQHDINYQYYYYLVEDKSSGDLLLVARILKGTIEDSMCLKTIGFKVYKLVERQHAHYESFYSEKCHYHRSEEPVRKTWEKLESLSNGILFVGCNRTLLLDSNLYPKCRGNCIYFADDGSLGFRRTFRKKLPHDSGVYYMSDKRIKYFTKDISGLLPLKAVWFSPSP